MPKENCDRKFFSAYITDTRLMGAMAMGVQWEIINSPDAIELFQVFSFDTEEYGFENHISLWDPTHDEISVVEHSTVDCLGGKKIPITEREACSLLQSFFNYNKEHGLQIPPQLNEYKNLLDTQVSLSDEEYLTLFEKQCTEIVNEYQLLNYFLMRTFGRDFEASMYLMGRDFNPDVFKPLPMAIFCKNTIDENENFFLCESLIEVNNQYQIIVSKLKVENMKIVHCEKQSGFSISSPEAAMLLSRPEFITVFEISMDPDSIASATFEFRFHTMSDFENSGKLFIAFNENNDHVKEKTFLLSKDIFGIYFITNYGQLILTSYNISNIRQLEKDLLSSSLGKDLIPTGRFEFTEPVFYEFIQSDFDDFMDFLSFTNPDFQI